MNYRCCRMRICPSTWKFHFIWTNLFFKGSIQLLGTNTSGSLTHPSILRGIWSGGRGSEKRSRVSVSSEVQMAAVRGLQFRIPVQWTLDAINSWETPDLPTSLHLGALWRTITVLPPVCSQSRFHFLSAKCVSAWPLTNNSRFLFLVLFLFFNSD